MKSRRLLLSDSERAAKSEELVRRLLDEIPKEADSFLFYAPFKGEVDLLPLADSLLKEGKVVAFPKVVSEEIRPIAVGSLRELSPGFASIREPSYSPHRVLKRVDVVFVPGIAFDLECFRLGYGGGFYDRFLANWEVGTKIGICFDFQVLDRLPVEPFDQLVDLVVTEKRTIKRRKKWS